jgi:transcriptional regulator with XRE-family HTH domain
MNTPLIALVAKNIARVRKTRKLSQRELAAKSGVGEKTLSSFECGSRTHRMKLSHLVALASALDVAPVDLLKPIAPTGRYDHAGCDPDLPLSLCGECSGLWEQTLSGKTLPSDAIALPS